MLEEQTQKLYSGIADRLDNLFSRKPFVSTLIVSAVMSGVVFIVASDYNRGEAKVSVDNSEVVNSNGALVSTKVLKELKVDLAGAVNKPGVYVLSPNSRLQDVLVLGEGFTSDVSSLWVSKNLNLSQSISDGEKIYIPFEWDIAGLGSVGEVKALNIGIVSGNKQSSAVASAIKRMTGSLDAGSFQSSQSNALSASAGSSVSSSGSSTSNWVNVNTATSSELDALPGIGPAFAGRVVENRPYEDFVDFKEKSGLSANLVESLKDLITY